MRSAFAPRSPSMTTTEIPSTPSCAPPAAQSCLASPSTPARCGPDRAPSTSSPDDVDAVFRRAAAANAEIVQPPHRTALGSAVPTRASTARDPECNLWTFGTYRGAHRRRAAGTRFPSPRFSFGASLATAGSRTLAWDEPRARCREQHRLPAIAYGSVSALPRWPCSRRSSVPVVHCAVAGTPVSRAKRERLHRTLARLVAEARRGLDTSWFSPNTGTVLAVHRVVRRRSVMAHYCL
jgi:hypothetical protein